MLRDHFLMREQGVQPFVQPSRVNLLHGYAPQILQDRTSIPGRDMQFARRLAEARDRPALSQRRRPTEAVKKT